MPQISILCMIDDGTAVTWMQHSNCSTQQGSRLEDGCLLSVCKQASIGALPRLHPGLLVARAQAADLASRLQAHAQVGATIPGQMAQSAAVCWRADRCVSGGLLCV